MEEQLSMYCDLLKHEEKCDNTIKKYRRDILKYLNYLSEHGLELTKESVIAFKKNLLTKYEVSSCNSILVAVNSFLKFLKKDEYCVKVYKLQRKVFTEEKRSMEMKDYIKITKNTQGLKDKRINQIIHTFAETGIRVSELRYITVQALEKGQAVINNKGKIRVIILTQNLVARLKQYCQENRIVTGSIFITKSGKSLDRFYIWRMMKRIAIKADVLRSKVFPHNFRHLFAKTFYEKQKDIVRLADFLGHSNIETTRIYVATSNLNECRVQLEHLFRN
ncbi:tyrosine-type recombinase/integrase [Anaerorhabdus sp.]|uniref:tyrosine-type recombinase/integrase n=1 Tax=Anaerorhabdus sp. TaxID=1872524 RepID=UPI002FC61541